MQSGGRLLSGVWCSAGPEQPFRTLVGCAGLATGTPQAGCRQSIVALAGPQEAGSVDIIIDDGSHQNEHVIKSFMSLFPLLSHNGIYAIEDVQTSYWPDFGGTSDDLSSKNTIMGFFKDLTDSLNYEEFIKPDYAPTYFDKHIVSIHFYHNLIIITKGINDEMSNMLINNVRQ